MLLALPALARVGYKVNARGCRQFSEGLGVLRDARRRHRLPHLAVLALGADASVSAGQIAQARKIMGPKRKLGLVTPRELGGGESNDAKVIRNAGQRDPVHIKVLDWVHYSAGHGELVPARWAASHLQRREGVRSPAQEADSASGRTS